MKLYTYKICFKLNHKFVTIKVDIGKYLYKTISWCRLLLLLLNIKSFESEDRFILLSLFNIKSLGFLLFIIVVV